MILRYGNKKGVGVGFSVPILTVGPSHCLCTRISNASQPTPSSIILFSADATILTQKPVTKSWDIIYPRRRSAALPLCTDSKLRSLTVQTVTFLKTSFSLWKNNLINTYQEGVECALPQDSIKILRPALPTG